MAGPTSAQIDHYVRMFERLAGDAWDIGETCWWTVVRGVTVADVVRRLHGDPDALVPCRPVDLEYEEDVVFVEQRDDAVLVVGCTVAGLAEDHLPRLSAGTTAYGLFWLVNNYNQLYHHVDGTVRTALDVLRPRERWGGDPEGLADHLGALTELADAETAGPDWETAAATLESLAGLRLDADWFHRPQLLARLDGR